MRKIKILTLAILAAIISGCTSTTQPTLPDSKEGYNSNAELKNDRDYIAYVARANFLNIVDAKEHKLYKTCKLEHFKAPGGLVVSKDGNKAFVLQDNFQSVNGYDMNTCKKFFRAELGYDNVIARSIFSFNISPDDKRIYVIANEVEKNIDHYKVLDPKLNVFNISDGLNAKPVKKFKAPRQISVIGVDKFDFVYGAGADIYKINPRTGETTIAAKHRTWDRKNYSKPDSLAMWSIGQQSNEFMTMYTAAKWNDSNTNREPDEIVWGATRVDLNTGKVEQGDFGPFYNIMFTGMTHPKDPNLLYGVLTQLNKYDRKAKKLIKGVDLDHTYYCLNFASDGSELYIAGGSHVLIVDPETLESKKRLELPHGDIGAGTMQVFRAK